MAIVLLAYMGLGCGIFSYLEFGYEQKIKDSIRNALNNFTDKYPYVNKTELRYLLDIYGNATYNGFVGVRPRWDFYGSLYFTWTVVSTVGYGMTTPHTLIGKMFLMAYGLLGCAGGILFFNLFLERVINLLANTLRWLHTRRRWRKKSLYNTPPKSTQILIPRDDVKREDDVNARDEPASANFSRMPMQPNNPSQGMKAPTFGKDLTNARSTDITFTGAKQTTTGRRTAAAKSREDEETLEKWKPSVYWVLIILFLLTCFIGCTVSLLYSFMEKWSYTDSLYFCFISFATIGFGDFVSNQKMTYDHVVWYKIVNFVILALGSCCVYSLLNVISIVIKQFLNLILTRFKRECWRHCKYCLSRSNKERYQLEQGMVDKAARKKDRTAARLKKEQLKREGQGGDQRHREMYHKMGDERHHHQQLVPDIPNRRESRIPSMHAISNGIIKWKRKKDRPSLSPIYVDNEGAGGGNLTLLNPGATQSQSRHMLLPLATNDHGRTYDPTKYASVYTGPSPMFERKLSDRSEYNSRSPWRKDSGDMVSMQDFLVANKPDALEEMQKLLLESNKKIGFTNTLLLPFGSFEEETPISPPMSAARSTTMDDVKSLTTPIIYENASETSRSATVQSDLKTCADTTALIPTTICPSTSLSLYTPNTAVSISSARIPQPKMMPERSVRKPFNIARCEPPDEPGFTIKGAYVYSKPQFPVHQQLMRATNIIISTDTDYDEEEQILRDHQRGREISFKDRVTAEAGKTVKIPAASSISSSPKGASKANTSTRAGSILATGKVGSKKKPSAPSTTSTPIRYKSLRKNDSFASRRQRYGILEGGDSSAEETENESGGTDESESSEDDDRLAGEEVGPLAILNKTLGTSYEKKH